jgi:hypothetical protein
MMHFMNSQLSPAEALVLHRPNRAAAAEAVKVTLLWLSAQGLLRIEEETKKVQSTGRESPPLWPDATSVMGIVCEANSPDERMLEYLAKRVHHAYGHEFTGFLSQFIMPSLVRRGLLEQRRVLLLFPKSYLTRTGTIEKTRIAADIAQACTIPALQSSDPAEAAAVALTVGGSVLPVEELQSHYRQLSQVIRSVWGAEVYGGGEGGWGGGGGYDGGGGGGGDGGGG